MSSCCDNAVASDTAGVTYTRIARNFVIGRGWRNYTPDQSFVTAYAGERVAMIQGNTHAMVYLATSSSNATVDMSRLCGGGGSVHVQRFDPVTGGTSVVGDYSCSGGSRLFTTGGLADAVILFDPASTLPSIAFVQAHGAANFAATSTTLTSSFNSPVGSGHTLIVAVSGVSSAASQVTDSAGNAYHLAVTDNGSSLYYAKNIVGGIVTVKASFSAPTLGTLTIHEYSGLDPISPLDKVGAASAATGTTEATNTVTTTFANELVFGYTAVAHNSFAGVGFTERVDNDGNTSEDKIVSTAGSYNVTFTQSASGGWSALMATFRAAGQ
jgi:hypothetical protein